MGFGLTHPILDVQNPQIKGLELKGTVARVCGKVGLGSYMNFLRASVSSSRSSLKTGGLRLLIWIAWKVS